MQVELTLWEAFAQVPDPRQASGKRYPLPALLALTTLAMLAGARTLLGIAEFGRHRGAALAQALGFPRGQTPCCATLFLLFNKLDGKAFEAALRCWLQARAASGWQAASLDGKTLRGTRREALPGVHLLTAYAHEAQTTLAQLRVETTTNEHKTALELLKIIPVAGRVVLGDAALCQRDLSQAIVSRKGDYVWTVKENQPELRAALALAFEECDFSPLGAGGGGA